ncbi:MAG TPA: DUF1080 domain-containing protein [Candidatus Hydrogenedentes bacterium]|nr:DUF1080 domain-containing protein [Candidatus Hydrogenedentota bacterium]
MFNGRDLTGWDGKPGEWWVEDGAITSQSTDENPCIKHHYLFWTEAEPGDFILRFEFKLVGGNSGVQFRSERREDYDIWGYQADMEDGEQWTGCLFQHDRGGVVMRGFDAVIREDGSREEKAIGDPADLLKQVRKHKWNRYEVTAIGNRITLKINDVVMCSVEDHDRTYSRSKGVIALQMHPGPPMKVQFRNLRIKILDAAPQTPKESPGQQTGK